MKLPAANGREPACRLAGITLEIPRLSSGSQPAAGRSSTKCLLHKIKVSLIQQTGYPPIAFEALGKFVSSAHPPSAFEALGGLVTSLYLDYFS